MHVGDDRRYMTHEQRAATDARYRPGGEFGIAVVRRCATVICHCGKTVFVDGFGTRTGNTCPQCGETGPTKGGR